jgi:mobilome CxxCx(11)CxxC protein
MDRTAETDRISSDCWERALFAYGTATIFLKRSRKYKRLLQWLGFVGIIVPLVIGGAVLGFGLQASYLPALITVAAALGLLQLGFSAWSIVFSWSDNLAYGLESAADNFSLADSFKEMASQAMSPPADLQIRFASVKAKDEARRAADAKNGVTEKELRFGHRAGLRQFGRECTGCKKVPQSLDSTDCAICGRF